MFSDPVNFIDPNGEIPLLANFIGAVVGAAYDGYKTYKSGGSLSQIIGSSLVGGASGFVEGRKVGFRAAWAFISNISAQVASPNFNGIDFSQAAMVAALSAANLPDKYIRLVVKGKVSLEVIKRWIQDGVIFIEGETEKDLLSCQR